MTKYDVSYNNSIPVIIEAESASEAREIFKQDAEEQGYEIDPDFIEAEEL